MVSSSQEYINKRAPDSSFAGNKGLPSGRADQNMAMTRQKGSRTHFRIERGMRMSWQEEGLHGIKRILCDSCWRILNPVIAGLIEP